MSDDSGFSRPPKKSSARKVTGRPRSRKLARRAGVTKPVIYRHFPGGKVEIYREVLEEHLAALLAGL
ncbi:MAG: TetR/AcrR family transcriptional regulator [Actinomycetota bacterium]